MMDGYYIISDELITFLGEEWGRGRGRVMRPPKKKIDDILFL